MRRGQQPACLADGVAGGFSSDGGVAMPPWLAALGAQGWGTYRLPSQRGMTAEGRRSSSSAGHSSS